MMKCYSVLGIFSLTIVLAISSSGLAKITDEDFVAYWLLDDGGGDEAVDGSGNEHHAIIIGGNWDKGQIGGGLEFDGASTFMEILHSDEFNFVDSITIAVWARIDNLPQDHSGLPRKETEYVLHPTNAGGNGFNLRFYIGTGSGWAGPVISETVVDYGEWHHLAGTYDGEQVAVYIDGKLDKSPNQSGEMNVSQNPIHWSNDCCGRWLLAGLDELAILNRALDEAEIEQLAGGIVDSLAVEPAGKLAALWGGIKKR